MKHVILDRVFAQAISCRPLAEEVRFRSRASHCEVCVR